MQTIPIMPITIPSANIKSLPFPITFMHRHIPIPKIKAEIIPKVYVKTAAGRFALASSLRRATSLRRIFVSELFCVNLICIHGFLPPLFDVFIIPELKVRLNNTNAYMCCIQKILDLITLWSC